MGATAAAKKLTPAEFSYAIPIGAGVRLAITLPAEWVASGRGGETLFKPPAVRMIERFRALFASKQQVATPGYISTLRESLGMTQTQFAAALGVAKMTVSRWECGTMRPKVEKVELMRELAGKALRSGVAVTGDLRR